MTVDELIAEATRNRSGPVSGDAFSPPTLSECLRFALSHLLEDLDYEADPASGGAIAARALATIISGADEAAAKAVQ
ncbi:MAG: hypothetical protein KIT48_11265 [Pseudolabrys sp.]|nr:hypothetical protein [Pseudolabrys sp.]